MKYPRFRKLLKVTRFIGPLLSYISRNNCRRKDLLATLSINCAGRSRELLVTHAGVGFSVTFKLPTFL